MKWIDSNKPPTYATPEEEVIAGDSLKREDSLDELGAITFSLTLRWIDPLIRVSTICLTKAELGMRQVDDFGIVDAGIDAARISKNLDTVEVDSLTSSQNLLF